MSDVAEVHSLAALAEEQETVEYLEELGRGLMDRAEDREAVVRETAQEGHDSPCALRVETGGRFVQEQQETGLQNDADQRLGIGCNSGTATDLGSELDTDRRTLAVFNPEGTNDSIRLSLESTHVQDLFDVGLLLRIGDRARLAHLGGEEERFADGGRGGVRVHLLAVSSLTLEIGGRCVSVDEAVTSDYTCGRPLGEHVEKCGLQISALTQYPQQQKSD